MPTPWAGVLLALGVYRLVRILIADEITEPLRTRLLGVTDEEHGVLAEEVRSVQAGGYDPWGVSFYTPPIGRHRYYLSTLSHCPWCAGWWISLAVFAAYEEWPHGTVIAALPFALSCAVGLLGRNLDA